jgi:hypothetical protein
VRCPSLRQIVLILVCALSVAAAPATRRAPSATTKAATKPSRPLGTKHVKEDAPEDVKALAAWTDAHREQIVKQRLAILKKVQADRSFPPNIKQQNIADARMKVEEARTAVLLLPTSEDPKQEIKKGWIGLFFRADVIRVIDEETMMVKVKRKSANQPEVLLSRYDTSKATEGKPVWNLIIWITDTTTETGADGSPRTILKGQLFNPDDYLTDQ